jgi:hypothetical protein
MTHAAVRFPIRTGPTLCGQYFIAHKTRNKLKRASYRDAIDFIAYNDEPGADEALEINGVYGMATVLLISEIFGVPQKKVAQDVVKLRIKHPK